MTGALAQAQTAPPPVSRPPIETDVCIYGGTSGGLIAAVELSRLGRRVEVVSPTVELGGMTTGGLSNTDVGEPRSIGGLAREFYTRVTAGYRLRNYFNFEPKVATALFAQMLQESGVTPRLNERLAAVTRDGTRITELRTARGLRVRAKMFIDATYEGDLMAAARVSYTVGRESSSQYGEIMAGVRRAHDQHQFRLPIDAFRRSGNRILGLAPGVQPGELGQLGDGDGEVQAYNYRLILTTLPWNRIPIPKPAGYAEENYTLLARFIAARLAAGERLQLGDFLNFAELPGHKYDVNSNGPFSTDAVGLSTPYPEGSDARRAVIAQAHRRHIQGLIYFLGTSPSVPANIRWQMLQFGLCRDEFRRTGGWPHQLYVREARRMVGSYIMQQQNCEGLRPVTDSVALGSYTMDSHVCRRLEEGGRPVNEGLFELMPPAPYGISYRSLLPKASECSNLFVTFALSASHVAFSSVRMEPVFMMLSQSAANAADLAIAGDLPVQEVPYSALAPRLRARGQILTWPLAPVGALVVDNQDPQTSTKGTWRSANNLPGFYSHDYSLNAQAGAEFRFAPALPADGEYDVYLVWIAAENRSRSVPVEIMSAQGPVSLTLDQRRNGGRWTRLGRWPFRAAAEARVILRTAGDGGMTVSDAVAFVPAGAALPELPFLSRP